jgi:hypothetical protein
MGPSGEGLAIGGVLTGRPDQLWALVVGVDDGRRQAGLDGCRTKCSFSSATPVGWESRRSLAIDTSASGDGTIGLTHLAGGGAEVVVASGLEAGPLGGETSVGAEMLGAFPLLRPAGRRVLPPLLPTIDGHANNA